MYTEMYPNLKNVFNFQNFEEIAETLDKHFKGLFNLQVLENEAKHGNRDGSYMQFFTLIMSQLKDLYTVGEVSSKIYDLLKDDQQVRNCFLERLIFVPPVGSLPSTQMAFLEKTATGEIKVAEPVTFLDMLRVTWNLHSLKSNNALDIAVLNLDSIEPNQAIKLKRNNRALMVNFNRDSKGTPKWGVVDLRNKSNPQVYCETPLLEAEKQELEQRLDIKFKEVSQGKSDSLQSTGYTAIAWLDQNITKAWNFDTTADFNVLLGSYVFAQFKGDSSGIHFSSIENEYDRYVTAELKAINRARYGSSTDPEPSSKKWGGYSPIKLAGLAMLGTIEGESIELNDLAKTIRIVGGKKLSDGKFTDYSGTSYRSNVPRFDYTISDYGHPRILVESAESVSLTVPDYIDRTSLELAHKQSCDSTNTNNELMKFIKRGGGSHSWEVDAATAMVLTLFRARAKKKELVIHLPTKFQISADEQRFIINLMQDNPYVTEFKINNNQSLNAIKKELLPVFARNRWLAENGYRPPLVDNYWQRAAKYWLIHLNEQQNILADKREHDSFKRCVREMGLTGLNSVLYLLRDESQREVIEGIYAKNKPEFYAACQPDELNGYLDALIKHLKHRAYFPFSELGISWQPGTDKKYIELISQINQLDQFEEVTLSDCLVNPKLLKTFLIKLAVSASEQQWVGLIVIPELEDKQNVSNEYRELCSVYANLNNVILHNRHLKASAGLVEKIKAASDFSEPSIDKSHSFIASPSHESGISMAIEEAFAAFTDGKKQGPWPVKRGGAVQLQLQQQQEIQQSRQIQQEQQKTQMQVLEEVIAGERVTYKNIDALLGKYYREFSSENIVDRKSAALREIGESELQGFFHTWVNANPSVEARQVIQSMTLDAAKMLLRKHVRFSSGLNLENMPRGFYTQRAKDGSLVLCYNPEVGYVSGANSFTLDLNVTVPKADMWEGDFRLFNIEKYLKDTPSLTPDDFQSLVLFAKLQPPKDYQHDFDAFCSVNREVKQAVDDYSKTKSGWFLPSKIGSEKAVKHWLVFMQAWQYEGLEGVRKFFSQIDTDESKLSLDLPKAYAILFQNQSVQLKEWVASTKLDEKHLRAIGQVYYRYGDEVVALLLAKFRQIDTLLGREFFERFNNEVLSRSENYDCFITERFFSTMDDMIFKLQPHKAMANRHAWLTVSEKHMQTVPWENVETLWKAFDYFLAEISELGLELKGDEFDGMKAENMLVAMDRILETLKRIPAQDEKVSFLRRLSELQLTHGGVHYAIMHEGFKYFDDELQLRDFAHGTPTYGPNLASLYHWRKDETTLNIKRTLASCSQFSHDNYRYLSAQLAAGDELAKDALIWLMYTQYDRTQVESVYKDIAALGNQFKSDIARHLHHAAFVVGNQNINVAEAAMLALDKRVSGQSAYNNFEDLLAKFHHGTFLEATSILWLSKQWDNFDGLLHLLEAPLKKQADYPDYLFREGYKLAALFGITDSQQLKTFHDATSNLKPVVQNQLRLLINQIMSVDYDNSELARLKDPLNWQGLLQCVEHMKGDLAHTAIHRISLIEQLNQRGINFKYSKSGEFRALKDNEVDRPAELGFFVDHQARLWNFMMAHIAVPVNGDAKAALQPMIRFFKKMQLNRTYLNEIEPLLATLEKTANGQFWTAGYFYEMLKALQPEDDQTSFPIPLLGVMIKDITLSAKSIDSVEKEFPKALETPIQNILKNTIFDRSQQSLLCELALKEFGWQKSSKLLGDIILLLSPEERAISRDWALRIFAGSKNINELENRIENARWLLENDSSNELVIKNWSKTTALWLKAMAARQNVDDLFGKIRGSLPDSPEKRALILHIVAWSSLNQGLRSTDAFEYELNEKAAKLVSELIAMKEEDLTILAQCYPKEPSPGTEDALMLLKRHKNNGVPFKTCVDDFLRHPHSEPRMDFQTLAKTREADLQRMFAGTQITIGKDKVAIPADKAVRLSLIFADLKQLQAGTAFIHGASKSIDNLTQEEIAQAFNRLSKMAAKDPSCDVLRAQIWALLFEALGRTTRKYPHLAQQFALIANDVCIESATRVLQLATGEGKSHFVALRAARQAGMGKVVDVCTAKRTLAERDLEDYQSLFDYLGLSSSYIHPRSARETYMSSQIHYSTTGDLSLFLDEQSFKGKPIEVARKNRVALFDEFDFIRFEEGRKTEYNYARPTGKTPKQMTWFYQVVNKFYTDNEVLIDKKFKGNITVDILKSFAEELQKIAGEDEDKQSLVTAMLREPLQLVRWLQSAHETHELVMGINFTVREESIAVGDTTYPMREIIPLSSDNQKMAGSTFSAGVQQLLAVRMNTEAKLQGQPQNYHIHPESNIISSQVAAQRMKELWGNWEGFSGTISASQAQTLFAEDGTTVLHVPTNQLDLRDWHAPSFYKSVDKRLDALVRQIRVCLDNKKSVLFSCKNDAQVKTLQDQLKIRLSPEEYANFIFYTNEDEASASEVLSEKRTREAWHGGKKQRAVGLVASGFGRGDNVGVEAVFLFNVNDVNDLLQKGGRTARNGEEGEVFQFYMLDELEEEYKSLLEALNQSKGVDMKQVNHTLGSVNLKNDGDVLFARVMLLREYVFSLQNAANQGYHAGLAQYSSWGMGLIGKFTDPTTSVDFSNRVTSSMKNLEKRWLDISSNNKTSPDEKVREVENAMQQASRELHFECKEALKGASTEVVPFYLNAYPTIQLEMVAENSVAITDKGKDLSVICTTLARLPVDEESRLLTAGLPLQINELSQDADALRTFANQLKGCDTRERFASLLELALIQVRNASKLVGVLKKSAMVEVATDALLNDVAATLRQSLIEGLNLLLPDISDKIIEHLGKKNILSNEARIQAVMPLVTYLGGFSMEEQKKWSGEYLYNLDKLLYKTPVETLSMKLSGSAMSYRHLDSLWKLAAGFAVKADLSATWGLLQEAIGNDPEQRLRIYTKWEAMAQGLGEEKASEFLASFSKVMAQFSEGKDWDTFISLVEKTKLWWNKDSKHANKDNIIALWKQLANNSGNLPALNGLLTASLKVAGKNWFSLLSIYMNLSPKQQLDRQSVFTEVLQSLETMNKTGREKRLVFQALVQVFMTREDTVSSAHIVNLMGDVPSDTFIGEYLAYSIQLPQNIDKEATLNMRENLARIVLCKLEKAEFFTKMQAAERKVCLQDLNHIFANLPCEQVEDAPARVTDALELYTEFLKRLTAEEKLFKAASFASLAQWYVAFIKQHPEARSGLSALQKARNASSAHTIEGLVKALSCHEFSTAESIALLRLVKDENLTDMKASNSCQQLSSVNKTLAFIERLGSEAKAIFKQELLQLAPKKMQVVLQVLSKHSEEAKVNPQVLGMIIRYGKVNSMSAPQLGALSLVLLKALGKQQCSDIKLAHIEQGVNRFRAASTATLERLLDLMERNPDHLEEFLFDNVANHLEEKVKDGARNQVKDVIDFFYEKAAKYTGQPELMFNMTDSRLAEMFDFTGQRKPLHNDRVIWMHLLNQHAFVTGKKSDKACDGHTWQWDFDKNQKLLQMGLECYIKRTAEILQDKASASVSLNRDLTVSQQTSLLALADELSIIGKPHLDLTPLNLSKDTDKQVEEMEKAIGQLMGNYSSSWFKSNERKMQIANLQTRIGQLIKAPAAESRYEAVFLAINQARLDAMDSDRAVNTTTSWKMNSSGKSRYFNTLNQMQDMVARHWVADLNAVQSFQAYKKHSKTELFGLTDRLSKALAQNDNENDFEPNGVRKDVRVPCFFFISDKTKDSQYELLVELRNFNTSFHSDTLTRPELESLLTRLRDDKSIMPGHLVTLANEILNRGEALAAHLETEATHEAKAILQG